MYSYLLLTILIIIIKTLAACNGKELVYFVIVESDVKRRILDFYNKINPFIFHIAVQVSEKEKKREKLNYLFE